MVDGDPPIALTVAGSDSGSGAGIQADLKAMSALGVFATTAITVVTAQNTAEVRSVLPVPPATSPAWWSTRSWWRRTAEGSWTMRGSPPTAGCCCPTPS